MSHPLLATRAVIVATATAAALLTAVAPAQASAAEPATAPARTVTVAPAAFEVHAAMESSAVAARRSVVQIALGKVGKPYRYGASGPNAFDCSGLTSWAYKQVGVSLPRTSRAQSRYGKPVSRANLQPGDLVFFYRPVSHVAIYIGNGKIVHASSSGKPVKVSDLAGRKYHSARRV